MKYAKQEIDGIKIHNELPHPYKNYPHFPSETADIIEAEGFLPLTEPVLMVGEKYREIYQDGNTYVYKVINIQAEIDAEIEAAEENTVGSIINKRFDDGNIMLRKIERKLYRQLKNGNLTLTQYDGIQTNLYAILEPLQRGYWKKTQADLLLFPNYSNVNKNDALTKVRVLISNYMLNEYQ